MIGYVWLVARASPKQPASKYRGQVWQAKCSSVRRKGVVLGIGTVEATKIDRATLSSAKEGN